MTEHFPHTDPGKWKEEIERLYRKSYGDVYRRIVRQAGDEDAEDILQTVFLKLLQGTPSKEFLKNPAGYLYQAAMNALKNLHRSRQYHRERLIEKPVDELELAADSDRDPRIARLRDALAEMNPDYAAILELHYYEGLTVNEIAKKQGKRRVAVASQLLRAQLQVRKLMRIEENERETKEDEHKGSRYQGLAQAFEG